MFDSAIHSLIETIHYLLAAARAALEQRHQQERTKQTAS
jgi:hypothetical protein